MKARKRWEARYLSLEEGAGAARDAWDESRGYEPGEERRARMRSKREGVAAAPMIDRGPRDSREEQRSRSAGEGTREAQARRDAAFRARVSALLGSGAPKRRPTESRLRKVGE